MIYKDVFMMLVYSSSPKSGSLIDWNLIVEVISSGSLSKMMASCQAFVGNKFPEIMEFIT